MPLLIAANGSAVAEQRILLSQGSGADFVKQLHENTITTKDIIALARHLEKCWAQQPSMPKPRVIELRIQLNRDGTLAAIPEILKPKSDPVVAKIAIAAIIACQPYKMLSADKYEVWKDMIFSFAPPGA